MPPIYPRIQAGDLVGVFEKEGSPHRFRCCIALANMELITIYERKSPNSMTQLDMISSKAKQSNTIDLSELELKDPQNLVSLKNLKEEADYFRYGINILRAEDRGNLSIPAFLARLKANFIEIDKVNLGEIIKFNGSEFLGKPIYYHHALLSDEKRLMIIHKSGEPELKKPKTELSLVQESHLMSELTKRELSKDTSYQNLKPLPANIILQRARSRLGETSYNLVTDNCQHFCTSCRFGQSKSSDVSWYGTAAAVLGAVGIAAGAAYVLSKDDKEAEKKKKEGKNYLAPN